jgi:hypothetical protein
LIVEGTANLKSGHKFEAAVKYTDQYGNAINVANLSPDDYPPDPLFTVGPETLKVIFTP